MWWRSWPTLDNRGKTSLYPLQFDWRPNLGADNSLTHRLHRAYSSLNSNGCVMRIQSSSWWEGGYWACQETHPPSWIIDMIDRPHYVRRGSNRSNLVICCTGAPQGTALSPFLFTFYNSGSHSIYRNTLKILQRCMSDGQEEEYRALVDDFVSPPQLKPWQRRSLKKSIMDNPDHPDSADSTV